MPDTHENAPPPPEDRDFPRHGSSAIGIATIIAAALMTAAIIAVIISLSRADSRETAFLTKCSEFHPGYSEFLRQGLVAKVIGTTYRHRTGPSLVMSKSSPQGAVA